MHELIGNGITMAEISADPVRYLGEEAAALLAPDTRSWPTADRVRQHPARGLTAEPTHRRL